MFARRLLRDADSQFIGDLLSVRATAAYSLRRLYSSYTGNALTLRRSQDNAVADIGFTTAGELDTTALLNHVGYQNLLTHSEQFDNANWFKNNWSPLTNSAIAPNGTLTADKFVENTANGFHSTYRTSSVGTITGTYTFSVYLKAAGRSWAIVRFNNISNWFNLADGVLGTVGAGYTASITPAGDGWYRCAVTLTATALDTFPEILIATGNNVSIYTGDGTSGIFVWGAQFNQGSTPQPYQQTTTTAWTSLDGAVVTWYDQSGGSNNATQPTQPTADNQPRIVVNGVLQTQNSRPTLVGNGNQWLVAGTSTNWTRTTVDGANNVVAFRTSGTGTHITIIIGANNLVSPYGYLEVASQLGGFRVNTRSTPFLDTGVVGSVTSLAIVTATASSTSLNLHINGENQSSLTSSAAMIPAPPTSGLIIFDRRIQLSSTLINQSGTTFVGAISEVTIFKDMILSTTDRQTLERNQGAYYGITVI